MEIVRIRCFTWIAKKKNLSIYRYDQFDDEMEKKVCLAFYDII